MRFVFCPVQPVPYNLWFVAGVRRRAGGAAAVRVPALRRRAARAAALRRQACHVLHTAEVSARTHSHTHMHPHAHAHKNSSRAPIPTLAHRQVTRQA